MATYHALLSLKSSLDDPDSRLSALRLLNLSNNVFNRTFPPELSNLTNLRVLDLYNNLTGVLPVSVATFHWIGPKLVKDRWESSMISVCTQTPPVASSQSLAREPFCQLTLMYSASPKVPLTRSITSPCLGVKSLRARAL
ncbi:hypothetical protein ACLB2K_006859 [Fragaria x ananassa]